MPNASATDPDASRPSATGGDDDFSLTIGAVSERYAKAGHPRTIRTLQRYCVSGHLDARKIATTLGDKYLVTPRSVARHIAQIDELSALDAVASDRDQSRLAAAPPVAQEPRQAAETPATPPDGAERQATTANSDLSRYVERLQREVEQAKDERDFLREQIDRKDRTIDSLIERDRETNILVRGLQEMLGPLLGPGRREPPPAQAHNA
jgi:small-conductance mechanosensitive channel